MRSWAIKRTGERRLLAGGLVLLVTKPFVVGDYVEADGISGTIAAVDMSYTTFVTPDNKEIFVPNSQLSARRMEGSPSVAGTAL